MRGWLAPVLAVSLLLGDGATDGVAQRPPTTGPPTTGPATTSLAACPAAPALGSAGCAELLQRLATFAAAAYGDAAPATPPRGFQPAALAGLSLPGGRYTQASANALVMTTRLDIAQRDRAPVLVVGFGGSDAPATWLADLRNIDAPYRAFRPLVRAIEAYAAARGRVILVGHSFGGAIVQLFMFAHPGDDAYRAVTFGSPGALPQPGRFAAQADPRIANYVIADDPYVFLGEHRADVAAYARRNRLYALALAGEIAHESGLSLAAVAGSEPYLDADYVNNGARVVLPSRRSGLSVASVLDADPDEHKIETYEQRLGSGSG